MNQLMKLTKQNVNDRTPQENRYFKRRKLKVLTGKILLWYAALPLMSFWAVVPGIMLIGIKPTLWAKMKLKDLKQTWRLR